jgi:Na+/H+ antiporter NhaD/arsenite permease-like protein
MLLPFATLLLSIAVLPLNAPRVWEKLHPWVAGVLGALTAAIYATRTGGASRLLETGHEYASFMSLIASLYVVCGGIHISVKGEATPRDNCLLLLIGALLANIVGTTGASMLLIRPWIRMNKYRITDFHVVFFIFIVSNIGGLLTPVGDPPLFLGYLKGVPFWWMAQNCWPIWCTTVTALLLIFYAWDRKNFLRAPAIVREKQTSSETWKIRGWRNVALLGLIQTGLLLPPGWREAGFGAAAFAAWWWTPRPIHEANDFEMSPLREVAWLFAGIFATMLPALDLLQANAGSLGLSHPHHFYWATGVLSSVLDNAPTYLAFLSAASGLSDLDLRTDALRFAMEQTQTLAAISTGAVFFGAVTYLGNGPNLMVNHIARQQKVNSPSFTAYILRFSLPVLLPLLALVGLLFF